MPSSTSIGGMQVKVRLNKDNQPEFGKLLSLASSGIKHADVDSGEEADDKSSRDETGKTSVADGSRKKSTTTGMEDAVESSTIVFFLMSALSLWLF